MPRLLSVNVGRPREVAWEGRTVAEELGLLIDGGGVLLPSEPGPDAEPATEDCTR